MIKARSKPRANQPTKKVELENLQALQPFTYKGLTYTKRKVGPAGIKCISSKGNKLITLPHDTLVEIPDTDAG